MRTKGVRLHGKKDLRLDEFELPSIGSGEILARVVTDSICMSTYKMALLGEEHKRVPEGLAERPVMVGHEFCGELIQIGEKWRGKYRPGSKFTMQTALNRKEDPFAAPGFSYPYIGGTSTYIIIPEEVMVLDCLLPYSGDSFFHGSLAEPLGCVIGAFNASYHTQQGSYIHEMGIRPGGMMAILGGTGPMGLGAIDYALHCERRPKLLVVTDIDEERLKRAAAVYSVEEAASCGVKLIYVNTIQGDSRADLLAHTKGRGFDDVMVFAPAAQAVALGDSILGKDGCLNFFAGPTDTAFAASLNFYNVHYAATHVAGTTGGSKDDMKQALDMMRGGTIDPVGMITHIGGLNCAAQTTMNLPNIGGGKKLIYTHKNIGLTAIEDFAEKGRSDPFFAELARIVNEHDGCWCKAAEDFLLGNAEDI